MTRDRRKMGLRFVEVLNRVLASDADALGSLISARAPCSSVLADDPEIQVMEVPGRGCAVGLLGLLNGILGGPHLHAVLGPDGRIARFELRNA